MVCGMGGLMAFQCRSGSLRVDSFCDVELGGGGD